MWKPLATDVRWTENNFSDFPTLARKVAEIARVLYGKKYAELVYIFAPAWRMHRVFEDVSDRYLTEKVMRSLDRATEDITPLL